MKNTRRTVSTMLGAALLLTGASAALAQTATVDLSSQKQYIRGFGGMVHIPWIGDLTAAERTLAFGNGSGQLGLTVLRIAVPDGNTNTSSYVATAKAAIAAGGLVYASPWNSGGNMDSSQFASYADHLESFVTYMKSQGAELYAISVQNEPDYGDWRQWSATAVHDFIVNYGAKISTRLMTAESFQYRKNMYDQLLNDEKALANWDILGAHTYGTAVRDFPYPLFDQKGIPAGKERWMTEHYTDSNTDANQWPNALNVATDVHNSMVEGQFNVYTWWYIKRSYGPINNGAITKRGWCMAHWSKFVRPGYYRVDATKSPASGVAFSAYKGTDVVMVAVNTGGASSLNISIKGATVASCDKYTTSSSKSLANDGKVSVSGGSLTATLDGSSVTTLRCTSDDIPITGSGGSTGAAGAAGAGGASGAGGFRRPDAGRDGPGSGGVVGEGGNTGTGTGGGSGGRPGSGGTAASSGTGGSGSGGSGGGGPIGSGGVVGAGGSQDEAGGALGAGGTSHVGSTDVNVGNGEGCACRTGRPAGGEGTLVGLMVVPLLGWYLRRRRRVLK